MPEYPHATSNILHRDVKKKGRPSKLKNPVIMHGMQLEASDKIALIRIAETWGSSTLDLIRLGISMVIKQMDKAYAAENETEKKD